MDHTRSCSAHTRIYFAITSNAFDMRVHSKSESRVEHYICLHFTIRPSCECDSHAALLSLK